MTRGSDVTVLVTGVGDTVGQAVLKAARLSSIPCRIVATDSRVPCAGFAWADAAFQLPHSSRQAEYLDAIGRVCRDEGVQLILPGSEKELFLLAGHASAVTAATGAAVAASPVEVLAVALDKLETCRCLERAGLAFPSYARLDDRPAVARLVAAVGFPLVAKPCRGTGSRGRYEIDSWADIDYVRAHTVGMVLQERLLPDEEEYSVSVYSPRVGAPPGAISFRRDPLVAGDTYRAYVGPNPDVDAEAIRVAAALRCTGPCNVQLRRTARGPVTFEINPRFSGGTAMRAHFGYNDVEMAIRDFVLREPVPRPRLTAGTVLRYWEERYFDDPPLPSGPIDRRDAAP